MVKKLNPDDKAVWQKVASTVTPLCPEKLSPEKLTPEKCFTISCEFCEIRKRDQKKFIKKFWG